MPDLPAWLIGAMIGMVAGVIGGAAVLIVKLLLPQPKCPDCGEPLPRLRKPANRQQGAWGGAMCAECGCVVDRRGRKIKKPVMRKKRPAEPG